MISWLKRWLLGSTAPNPVTIVQEAPRRPLVDWRMVRAAFSAPKQEPWAIPEPPPGVLPTGLTGKKLAQDYGGAVPAYQWAGMMVARDNLQFFGFPYLAELSQRPEYRRPAEIIAKEMTRKWVRLTYSGTDTDGAEKLKTLEKALETFKVREKFKELVEQERFFGRSHLYIDTGKPDLDETPLVISKAIIAKGGLVGFKVIEPIWVYPADYDSANPRAPDFYRPRTWYVQGDKVHRTRLIPFISTAMPDLLKPAYSFAGLSLSQQLKPYVDNWLRTRQSVSDLIHSFSKTVLATDMSSLMGEGQGVEGLQNRAYAFNVMRDNQGVVLINKETEEIADVSTPLTELSDLQAQSQEQMASIAGLPLAVYLMITPKGLNASSEGEIRIFYSWIHSQQEGLFKDPLRTVLQVLQLHEFGDIDEAISFEFIDLWEIDDAADATRRKTDADTDNIYMAAGVISNEEIREVLINDKNGRYHGLTGPAPEPPEQDEEPDDGDDPPEA